MKKLFLALFSLCLFLSLCGFTEIIEIRSEVFMIDPEPEYFIINSGFNDGIAIGDGLIVHRDGEKIAEAYIMEVRENVSAAKILSLEEYETIQEGDSTLTVKKIQAMPISSKTRSKPVVKPETINIVTPYIGEIENIHKDSTYNLDLKDRATLKGIYFQRIKPDEYQWNLFLYNSKNVNYSGLLGAHLIFDRYFDAQKTHKNVLGAGFEYIGLDMDAGNNFTPLSNFIMTNNIYAPYARTGKYFFFGNKHVKSSIMPWIGYEHDFVRGRISFNLPMKAVNKNIESDYDFAMIGINLKTSLYHFLEMQAKYSKKFDEDDHILDTISLMTNLYFHRNWGLSYRFKYMEDIYGSNTYHMGGLSYIF